MDWEDWCDKLYIRVICHEKRSDRMTAKLSFGHDKLEEIELKPSANCQETGVWLGIVNLVCHERFKIKNYCLQNERNENLSIIISDFYKEIKPKEFSKQTSKLTLWKRRTLSHYFPLITVDMASGEYYCTLAVKVQVHFRAELTEQPKNDAYVVGDCAELGHWKPLESNRLNFKEGFPGVGHCKVKILAATDGESLTSLERPGEPLMVQLYTGKNSEHRKKLSFETKEYFWIPYSIPKFLKPEFVVAMTDDRVLYCGWAAEVHVHFRAELSEQPKNAAYVVGDCAELGHWKPLESNRLNFDKDLPVVGHCKVKILAATDGESLTSLERPGEPLMVQLYTGKNSEHRKKLSFEKNEYFWIPSSIREFLKPEFVVAMTDDRVLYRRWAVEVHVHFRAELSEQPKNAAYVVGDCAELGHWKLLESNRLNFDKDLPVVGHCKVKILAATDGKSLTSLERPGEPLMVQLYTGKNSEHRMELRFEEFFSYIWTLHSVQEFLKPEFVVAMTDDRVLYCRWAAEVHVHFRAELSEQPKNAAYVVGDCAELGHWKLLESNRLNFDKDLPVVGHCKVKILAATDGKSLTSLERPGEPLMVQLYTGKNSEHQIELRMLLELSWITPPVACDFLLPELLVRMTENEILQSSLCSVFPVQALIRTQHSHPYSLRFDPKSALSPAHNFEFSHDKVWICSAAVPQRLVGINHPLLTMKGEVLQTEIEITDQVDVSINPAAESSDMVLVESSFDEGRFVAKIVTDVPTNMFLIDIDKDLKCYKVITVILHFRMALPNDWKDNNLVIVGNWGFKNPKKMLHLKQENSFCRRHSTKRSDVKCKHCTAYLANSAALSVVTLDNMLLKSAHLCDIQFSLTTETSTQAAQPPHALHLSVDRGMNFAEFVVNLHDDGSPDVRIVTFDFKRDKIFLDLANFLGNIRGLSSTRSNLANVRRIYAQMLVPNVSPDGSYACCEADHPQSLFDIWGDDPREEKKEEFVIPKSSVTYCMLRRIKFPNEPNAKKFVANRLRARYTGRENYIFQELERIIQLYSKRMDYPLKTLESRVSLESSKSSDDASQKSKLETSMEAQFWLKEKQEQEKKLVGFQKLSSERVDDASQYVVDEIRQSLEILSGDNCLESPKFAGSLIKVANLLNDFFASRNMKPSDARLLLQNSAAIVRGRLEEKLLMEEMMQNCIVTKAWFAFMMAAWNTIQPQVLEPEEEKKKFNNLLRENTRIPAFYTWRMNECPRDY